MNVYDFDGTIYKGDSSIDFFVFCLGRHPACALMLPRFAAFAAAYKVGRCDKSTLKQAFFSFLRKVPCPNQEVETFWERNRHKIAQWYFDAHESDDVIISASPDFLLYGTHTFLGISKIIATTVNPRTGRLLSQNCHGEEKAKRFSLAYPDAHIDNFFSDSLTDKPMAKLADKAWIVTGENVMPWKL